MKNRFVQYVIFNYIDDDQIITMVIYMWLCYSKIKEDGYLEYGLLLLLMVNIIITFQM